MSILQTDFQGQGINALNQGLGIGNAMQRTKQLGIDRQRQVEQDAQSKQMFDSKMDLMGQQSQLNDLSIQQQEKAQGMGELVTALNLPFEARQELLATLEDQKESPEAKKVLSHIQTLDDRGQTEFMLQVLDTMKNQGMGAGQSKKQKGEKGLVFNPNNGEFSIDPIYAENQKQINELDLLHKKKLHQLEVEKDLAKKRTAGIAEQERADITDGLAAAETMPILKRADKLLDIVETGKPRQALEWGKKWFGIQGANESELDNLLGKQILKQLKPIFGSQFTEGEGRWLAEMEANYGKSTEGNRALIRQGKALVQRRIDLGLDAAKYAGDERTINNLNSWSKWEFSEDPQAQKKTTELSEQEILDLYLPGKG